MLELEKLRTVKVKTPWGVLSDTAYDDGSKLYKVEDNIVFISCMPLFRNRSNSEMPVSNWKTISRKEDVEKITILKWPTGEFVEEITEF